MSETAIHIGGLYRSSNGKRHATTAIIPNGLANTLYISSDEAPHEKTENEWKEAIDEIPEVLRKRWLEKYFPSETSIYKAIYTLGQPDQLNFELLRNVAALLDRLAGNIDTNSEKYVLISGPYNGEHARETLKKWNNLLDGYNAENN